MTLPFQFSRRWLLWLLGCLLAALSILTIIGERGALHLLRLRAEKMRLDEQNYRLLKENEALRLRILQIRNNDYYLEKLAREELNMVRSGEIIYRFADSERLGSRNVAPNASRAQSRPSTAQRERR